MLIIGFYLQIQHPQWSEGSYLILFICEAGFVTIGMRGGGIGVRRGRGVAGRDGAFGARGAHRPPCALQDSRLLLFPVY